ncbi:sulfotransferase domain-containing protein [Paracoccus aminophilus]|nr:sulfotransferase domain-containing protein [Paracoccus aminophilus]
MSEPIATPVLDFAIIGIQKGGTTALHRFLSSHPQIFLPEPKELHFFNSDGATDWAVPDYRKLEAHFAKVPREARKGEATPAYIFHPHALSRLRAYNPAAKLITVLRDPVERAYSHWRMERTRQAETLDFPEAIRAGRLRVAENPARFSYVERGFYAAQIERLLALFPAEQCLFLTTDDLKTDHIPTLSRVWRFLGCDETAAAPEPQMIRPLLSDETLAPLSDCDRGYLRALYREDIHRVAALIGRDLDGWG